MFYKATSNSTDTTVVNLKLLAYPSRIMSIEHKERFPQDLMCLQLESMKVIKKCKIRLKNNMVVIRPNKNIMKKSFAYNSEILWNNLPTIYQQT